MSNLLDSFITKIGLLVSSLCTLLITTISAQNVQFHLLSSNSYEVVIRVDFPSYQSINVDVNGENMHRLSMDGAYPMLKNHAPELLQTSTSLIIPEGSQPSAEVLDANYTLIQNFEVAPSKGRLLRNVNPATIAYMKGAEYFADRYLWEDTISFGNPYILRDFCGIPIHFYPFSYNPVRKTLKVYSSITVKVHFNSNRPVKQLRKVVKSYDNIYARHFLNYQSHRSTPLEENGRILILAPDDFCAAMQPYASWKIKNGYPTEIIPLSQVGSTSTAIKNFISNYYTNHNDFAFLLNVGDNNQFPTISVDGNVSDNYYGEIAGNDVYPDIIIGKISAENLNHVTTQVERFIQYEQNPPVTEHLPIYCGIASDQGPGDDNEYDYQHIRNINTKLTNFTYTSGYEFYEGNQGGLDASGNPSASAIESAFNSGIGIVNYCGHGGDDCWVTSGFSNSNVNSLNNNNKLPFIFSVACVNGNYSGQTCFAEAWMRATKNGEPTGAVGTLMSTINQPWTSPMCAQDNMNDILTGISSVDQKYTFGGIIFNGLIKMLDEYNDYEVSRTWLIFGDPTLFVRTAIPQTLPLSYESQIILGTTEMSFTSSVNHARVTLSTHNEVVATGQITNGTLTLSIPTSLTPSDTLYMVATAQNYIPVESSIQIIPANGPYLICNSLILHDNGNNNGQADYSETVIADIVMENVGNEASGTVQMTFSTEDPYLTLTQATSSTGTITSNETRTHANAFAFQVAPNVPAFHTAQVNAIFNYDGEAHSRTLNITLHAPELIVGDLTIDDQTLGNNNHKIDLNESAHLNIVVKNQGNGFAHEGRLTVTSLDGKLILYRLPYNAPALNAGENGTVRVHVRAVETITEPEMAQLRATYTVDNYTFTKDFSIKIGYRAEDWESGNFQQFSWSNTSSHPWIITTQNPYEGQYAARSGTISHNSSSALMLTTQVATADTISFYYKVSSESGYDFLSFYIDNNRKGQWSGEVGWTQAKYAVTAGSHTFKWVYEKDYYMSDGGDWGMIDYIELPAMASPTSVESYVIENMTISPNPASDVIRVIFPSEKGYDNCQCQLYDLSGRLLQIVKMQDTTTELNLSSYAQGLYILKVVRDNEIVFTEKVIKQK